MLWFTYEAMRWISNDGKRKKMQKAGAMQTVYLTSNGHKGSQVLILMAQRKKSPYRGYDGPLKVTNYENAGSRTNILFDVLEKAGGEAGYPITKDTNGFMQEGFGPFDMTIDSKSGQRCSAAAAYLHPAINNPAAKLDIHSTTLMRKVVFDKEDSGKKPRAIGVECEDLSTGEIFELHAEKEVILSLGAVGSPQALMLSGIGDTEKLQKKGIADIVHHNPQVGANLQDHLEVYLQYLCTQPVSLYPVAAWTVRHFHERVAAGVEWFIRGTGICASNQFETGAFIRTDAGVEHPDIQYHFIPGCVVGQLDFLPHHGFQIHVGTLRPTSRGSIELDSNDPKQAPLIDPNFLGTEKDMEDMRKAVRLADEVIQQPAFAAYKGDRLAPEPQIDVATNDDAIDDWIRNSSHSAYHLSCTCAIGRVVDENGSVDGVDSLRVVDASIMPSMTSGNLNAPTIMLAEKLSDNILGKSLPAEHEPWYVAKDWQTKQR
mmetsp:Transcript_433/g.566  ORF Transcript_433/g.566 Transcript_433/m.566 type:complete len:487 (+) Transcript_433:2944-4404(+)